MLASWRGTRLDVMTVLREVCDNVLKEREVPEQVLVLRAKVYSLLRSFESVLIFALGLAYHWTHFPHGSSGRIC